MTFLLHPPPHLLTLNQEGILQPGPRTSTAKRELRKGRIAFRSTDNIAKSRTNDNKTRKEKSNHVLYVGNRHYYGILLAPLFIATPRLFSFRLFSSPLLFRTGEYLTIK